MDSREKAALDAWLTTEPEPDIPECDEFIDTCDFCASPHYECACDEFIASGWCYDCGESEEDHDVT